MEGHRVKVAPSLVRQFGIPALMSGISSWVKYFTSMDNLDYGQEPGYEAAEYRVWAEVLPGGAVRFHGKRIA